MTQFLLTPQLGQMMPVVPPIPGDISQLVGMADDLVIDDLSTGDDFTIHDEVLLTMKWEDFSSQNIRLENGMKPKRRLRLPTLLDLDAMLLAGLGIIGRRLIAWIDNLPSFVNHVGALSVAPIGPSIDHISMMAGGGSDEVHGRLIQLSTPQTQGYSLIVKQKEALLSEITNVMKLGVEEPRILIKRLITDRNYQEYFEDVRGRTPATRHLTKRTSLALRNLNGASSSQDVLNCLELVVADKRALTYLYYPELDDDEVRHQLLSQLVADSKAIFSGDLSFEDRLVALKDNLQKAITMYSDQLDGISSLAVLYLRAAHPDNRWECLKEIINTLRWSLREDLERWRVQASIYKAYAIVANEQQNVYGLFTVWKEMMSVNFLSPKVLELLDNNEIQRFEKTRDGIFVKFIDLIRKSISNGGYTLLISVLEGLTDTLSDPGINIDSKKRLLIGRITDQYKKVKPDLGSFEPMVVAYVRTRENDVARRQKITKRLNDALAIFEPIFWDLFTDSASVTKSEKIKFLYRYITADPQFNEQEAVLKLILLNARKPASWEEFIEEVNTAAEDGELSQPARNWQTAFKNDPGMPLRAYFDYVRTPELGYYESVITAAVESIAGKDTDALKHNVKSALSFLQDAFNKRFGNSMPLIGDRALLLTHLLFQHRNPREMIQIFKLILENSSAPIQWRDFFDRVLEARNDGDFDKPLKKWQSVISARPNMPLEAYLVDVD